MPRVLPLTRGCRYLSTVVGWLSPLLPVNLTGSNYLWSLIGPVTRLSKICLGGPAIYFIWPFPP